MERYNFEFTNGSNGTYEVFDAFDFLELIGQLEPFEKLHKWNYQANNWERVTK